MANLIITDIVGETGEDFLDIGGWDASDLVVKRTSTEFRVKATDEDGRVSYDSIKGTGLIYSKDAFPEPISGIVTDFSVGIGDKPAYTITEAAFDLKAYLAVEGDTELEAFVFRGADRLQGNKAANVLDGHAGNDWIDGGLGDDRMIGGTGNDVFIVSSAGDAVIEFAGGGTDTVRSAIGYTLSAHVERLVLTGEAAISGTGNSAANILLGNAGANVLGGGGGDDRLSGGAGNDVLHGGFGDDSLTGGSGRDAFVFDTRPRASDNVDTILDFSVADDTIRLDDAVFAGLAKGWLTAGAFTANEAGLARDAGDRIVYETDTGKLFYDANGSAGGGSVLIALLDDRLQLTANDFLVV